jgi:hypothetical protein
VRTFGTKAVSIATTKNTLSSGVVLISKPSGLHVHPWQMVSAVLGGVSLRTAAWWARPGSALLVAHYPRPEIDTTTTKSPKIACWDGSLGKTGSGEIATTGQWNGTKIGLTGGIDPDSNHAKLGVSISGDRSYSIFGAMNQQGTLSGPNCATSQNGPGGLFYLVANSDLSTSIRSLISGGTAHGSLDTLIRRKEPRWNITRLPLRKRA